jgi:hypothetical protein
VADDDLVPSEVTERRPREARSAPAYPGTPGWVKVFTFVLLAVVVAIVLVLVLGTALGLHASPGGHGG